jgi:hypothetical protein
VVEECEEVEKDLLIPYEAKLTELIDNLIGKREVSVKVKVAKSKKAAASEPRELTAKELAAMQFIAFPVGNGGMAYYPNPMSKVAQVSDDEVAA